MQKIYRSNSYIPELVLKTKKIAEEAGFSKSCTDQFGRLLFTLIGQVKGKILEVGTGYGVSTSWILSAMSTQASLISVDRSQQQIELIEHVLIRENVDFISGDWKEVIHKGPFNFIFADATDAKKDNAESLFEALEVGGILIMDDFTAEEYWPDEWKGKPDAVREFWLNHPRLAATEILLTPREAVIIASKLSD
jgi:predicted O-methyltransferase YrrM